MTRTRLAAATILSLSLLAPIGAATSAAAAPKACGESVQVKDHKHNKRVAKSKAKAKAEGKGKGKAKGKGKSKSDHGKKIGFNRPLFVHAGKVTEVDSTASTLTFVVRGGKVKALRGCTLTVVVTPETKIKRDDSVSSLDAITAGDHVNVKGTTARDGDTGEVTYTAKRVASSETKIES